MISGGKNFLRRILSAAVAASMLLVMLPALSACGGRSKITVWVYSDEYRDELEHFLKNTSLDLSFVAGIRAVSSADFEAELNKAIKSGKDIPDVFMLSPDNIKKYIESDVTAEVSELGLEVTQDMYFPYVVEAATNERGRVKAVGWQADPGIFMYRRSMAKVYLGTDNPDQIQAMVGSWDGFYDTAMKVSEASDGKTRMLAGQEDMLKPFLASDDQPWVKDGKLIFSPRKQAYVDYVKKMSSAHLIYTAEQWSEAWLSGISDTQSVFGYFSSGICMLYVMKKACGGKMKGEGSYGDWAVVPGPANYCWGGSWFAAYSGSRNKSAAGDFISLFTGCTGDETRLDQSIRYFRTTGEFAASSQIVSQVRFDPQFEDSFIGGQNYYQQLSVAAKGISQSCMTVYDSDIGGIFNTYMNQCAGGLKTAEQAVSDFKTSVSVAFPEIAVN
ncbi:MAG: extracellular solute-binding protein [Clostridia bacterium]|nr:extracellular solute-binding protein [Clostridia bacterium]